MFSRFVLVHIPTLTILPFFLDLSGAVLVLLSPSFSCSGCSFQRCASTKGGAVYVERSRFSTFNSSFESNTASAGAGVFLLSAPVSTIDGCILRGNFAL